TSGPRRLRASATVGPAIWRWCRVAASRIDFGGGLRAVSATFRNVGDTQLLPAISWSASGPLRHRISADRGTRSGGIQFARDDDPGVRPWTPLAPGIVAQNSIHAESGPLEPIGHARHGQRAKGEVEANLPPAARRAFDESLVKRREPLAAI